MKSLSAIREYCDSHDMSGLNLEEKFNLYAKFLEPRFEINETNETFYKQLMYYISNDTKFVGDLNKGLLVIGGFGTGKTLAMQVFSLFGRRLTAFFDSDQIIDTFTKQGRQGVEIFDKHYDIIIDELGQDSGEHYFFGSNDDPVEVLLGRRYKRFKDYGVTTYGISNLDAKMLQQRFSGKIYDRMCEMFNTLPLDGPSWRRKQ
jgi:hypothetical protein